MAEVIDNTPTLQYPSSHTVLTSTSLNQITTLLSTVLIEVNDTWNTSINVRALLDNAISLALLQKNVRIN